MDRVQEEAVTSETENLANGRRVRIRAFERSDLDQVDRLIQRTIDSCYPPVYPPRAVEFFKRFHAREAISERAADGLVIVIEEVDAIIATGAVVEGDITGVFVAPEYQGHGLGGVVMDRLEAAAFVDGCSSARLSVSLPSKGFYERRGYRVIGQCSDDVGEGQRLDYWDAEKSLADA